MWNNKRHREVLIRHFITQNKLLIYYYISITYIHKYIMVFVLVYKIEWTFKFMFYKNKRKLKLVSCCIFVRLYVFINKKANYRWHKTCLLLVTIHYNAQSCLLDMHEGWVNLGIRMRFHWAGRNGACQVFCTFYQPNMITNVIF